MKGWQGSASVLVVAVVVLVAGWLTWDQLSKPIPHASDQDASAAAQDAGALPEAGPAAEAGALAEGTTDAGAEGTDAGLALTLLGDGGPLLPSSAPRSVKVGIVLVQWLGAEGASSTARAKPEALKRALELAEQAKADFKAAVKAGDPGSAEDLGRMQRGFLEPNVDVAVFSLAAGDVSEPLETPRGYWVVKRLE